MNQRGLGSSSVPPLFRYEERLRSATYPPDAPTFAASACPHIVFDLDETLIFNPAFAHRLPNGFEPLNPALAVVQRPSGGTDPIDPNFLGASGKR